MPPAPVVAGTKLQTHRNRAYNPFARLHGARCVVVEAVWRFEYR